MVPFHVVGRKANGASTRLLARYVPEHATISGADSEIVMLRSRQGILWQWELLCPRRGVLLL